MLTQGGDERLELAKFRNRKEARRRPLQEEFEVCATTYMPSISEDAWPESNVDDLLILLETSTAT